MSRIAAALRRAGRSRGIAQTAAEIKTMLREPQLHQPLLVETAMGQHALALLAALDTACVAVTELGQASAELFQQHPDYSVSTTDSATWWPTSAAASAASRLRVEVSKNSITAASSKEGERVFRGPASEPPWV